MVPRMPPRAGSLPSSPRNGKIASTRRSWRPAASRPDMGSIIPASISTSSLTGMFSANFAPAYDAATEPGGQVSRVNLLDWPDTRTYLHVLADGVYACPLAEDQNLPEPLRFIPEFFTGRRLIFDVPAETKSLELFGAMPHA